jgi:hypothetical protein
MMRGSRGFRIAKERGDRPFIFFLSKVERYSVTALLLGKEFHTIPRPP